MRWLLTYADMLTLLFALFVIMYAMSKPQIQKVIEVQDSLAKAFKDKPASLTEVYKNYEKNKDLKPQEKQQQIKEFLDYLKEHVQAKQVQQFLHENPTIEKQINPPAVISPLRQLEEIKGKIDRYVGDNQLSGAMKATMQPERGLVIQLLTDGVLFDLGGAELKPQAKEIIKVVVQFIQEQKITNQIRVDGHTDDLPIHGGPFRDNMDLSMARAGNVWRYMITLGLPATQVSAAGYGPYRPVVPNDSDGDRRKNRRVEITIPPAEKEKIIR